MIRVAQRSLKVAGTIVPLALLHRFAACIIEARPSTTRSASATLGMTTVVSKPQMKLLWGLGPKMLPLMFL
jgi:hypothetical protein